MPAYVLLSTVVVRPQFERAARIEHPAPHRLPDMTFDLQRFACQRRLVEHRYPTTDPAIDRKHLAGTDD